MDIGNKIKDLRQKMKVTQEELAKNLNVSTQAVSKWECGFFGEKKSYVLPQTHAIISFARKTFFMEGFEEGTGFMPDYWMDDDNMIETFTKWLERKLK